MNTFVNNPSKRAISARRIVFSTLALTTGLFMLWLMHQTLAPHTPAALYVVLMVLFALTLPWMVVGFWNAIIGLLLCQLSTNPTAAVLPSEMDITDTEPLTCSTAILLCIRNETPERLERNLETMLHGLAAPGIGEHFHIYVLSDTNDVAIAAQEQACFGSMQQRWLGQIAITYRCRDDNAGYKAGNIEDFCKRWGDQHAFALTLDADSFMTSGAIVRLVRMMQANPRLGILQGLVVGLPSTSAFTRLFQYGMRLGMRSYTMGSAWWQSDCGPYWGHNAVIRLAPFIEHCALPVLRTRDGGTRHILSHDQIEAVLMRRAGFDVRVFPQEDESWEENPTTLSEYIRRDLRWCEGNLQYVHLLTLPKLKLMSRYQLTLAIFMFLGSPAWIALMILLTMVAGFSTAPTGMPDGDLALTLLVLTLIMWYLPKIAGALDVLLRKEERQRFGGGGRFALSLTLELLFSILMTPITWLNHTMFMAGLLMGRKGGWTSQTRDDHSVPLSDAIKQFWPHTLLGLVLAITLYATNAPLLAYGMIFFSGLLLAIPIAVFTSQPWLGRLMMQRRLLSLPEEIAPPEALLALHLKALPVQSPGFSKPSDPASRP
ncbi:glucans biosynthesis glucosyltransferase MdoH [Zwartia sp.]|uniref:glucans biosynthesis glucosyltransferase MdoH n=1 Tax=Zwartia sp. TaxID=2978004 RepID=UPI00271E4399|nr:glucans biosynthesis glucosyltransferase MdoH [Zwartia sp.]MDO9024475.1 glucans biosynthesis glucosyltransferase MdoH [Zwartia sp.]